MWKGRRGDEMILPRNTFMECKLDLYKGPHYIQTSQSCMGKTALSCHLENAWSCPWATNVISSKYNTMNTELYRMDQGALAVTECSWCKVLKLKVMLLLLPLPSLGEDLKEEIYRNISGFLHVLDSFFIKWGGLFFPKWLLYVSLPLSF